VGLRIATWNIRAAIGPGEPFPPAWWRHVRRDRFEQIAGVVAALDADVVLLQEVAVFNVDGELFDQPVELARLTSMSVRYAAAHAFSLIEPESGRTVGSAQWGNAILSRRPLQDGFAEGLPFGSDEALVEPEGSTAPLAGVTFLAAPYGTREPRCVLGGTLEHGGAAITVAGTHLSYAGRAQRERQATALGALTDDLATRVTGGRAVIGGDFNAAIEDPELVPLARNFEDAFSVVGVRPGDRRRASAGPNRIDHLLTRGLRALECRVVTQAGDASDHLPVVASFAL